MSLGFRASFRIVSTFRRQDAPNWRAVNNSDYPPGSQSTSCRSNNLPDVRLGIGPVVLESAPHENVSEAECVPPVVKHLTIEAQNALAGYACGRWSERGETIVHTRAIRIADAGEQVPNRERVFLAGVDEEDPKQGVALCWRVHAKVKSRQGFAEGSGSIFKIRCAWADLWACGTYGARG